MTGKGNEIWEMRIPCKEEEIEELLTKFPGFSSWAFEETGNKKELILYFEEKPKSNLYNVRKIQGWQNRYKDFFKGVTLEPFFIRPPWKKKKKDHIDIIINPGTGFGTGEHPSTQGVLISLYELLKEKKIEKSIDIGTGSGILAIAAVKLGVNKVVAVDKEPLAIKNASENVLLNKVSKYIQLVTGTPECIKGTFPLVMANLDFFALVENMENLAKLTQDSGYIIISGFLREDAETILQICTRYGLKSAKEKTVKEWCTLTLIKNAP